MAQIPSMIVDGLKAGTYTFPPEGMAFDVTKELKDAKQRYAVFKITAHTKWGLSFLLNVYSEKEPGDAVFDYQTGVLPEITATIAIDLTLLNGATLFPGHLPGQQKVTCHGRRVDREEISRMLLTMMPRDAETTITVTDLTLSDEIPKVELDFSETLIDEMGQFKRNEWPGKLHSVEEMVEKLRKWAGTEAKYPFPEWTKFGANGKMKLTEGTGFFSKVKKDGRWWLVDPDGYAFISNGVDCTTIRPDCRVDDIEGWLDWLPAEDDPVYGGLYGSATVRPLLFGGRTPKLFSFEQANLMKAFGDEWYEKWKKMIAVQFKSAGINTLGNWSDPGLFGTAEIPYVTSLPQFPATEKKIFRDFPDVLSDEYKENAKHCAEALAERKDDPWMIGYFLRNEPAWAFVNGLVVADEVLYSEEDTVTRRTLVERIKETYGTVDALNEAWKLELQSFDDLQESRAHMSEQSEEASRFLHEFSRELVRAYVEIPSKACREVDPNHMILGMRWAWISDPALASGWENFDVFSINCYSFNPQNAIQNVENLGVDLPVVIGEYHFGALDAGPLASGLEAVANQKDRGRAVRSYLEKTAMHPYGVGCHYFQYSDQFALGRFDGENYNIGFYDICLQPYEDLIDEVRTGAGEIYDIAAGLKGPQVGEVKETNVVAY